MGFYSLQWQWYNWEYQGWVLNCFYFQQGINHRVYWWIHCSECFFCLAFHWRFSTSKSKKVKSRACAVTYIHNEEYTVLVVRSMVLTQGLNVTQRTQHGLNESLQVVSLNIAGQILDSQDTRFKSWWAVSNHCVGKRCFQSLDELSQVVMEECFFGSHWHEGPKFYSKSVS